MIEIARQFLRLCNPSERRRLAGMIAAMTASAVWAAFGIASVVPFIGLVANRTAMNEHAWLRRAYEWSGVATPEGFLFLVGLATLGMLIASNAARAFTEWRILRFARDLEDRLATQLFATYLAQPYSFFVDRHTAELSRNVLAEVASVVNGLVVPAMNGLAHLLLAIVIVALLVVVDAWLALWVLGTLGGIYGAVFAISRSKQSRLGADRVATNALRFKVTSEALGGIKAVKALDREREFLARFSRASRRHARLLASNAVLRDLPRYAVESIAFGGMLVIVLYLIGAGYRLDRALPLVGLYAFASYRLMPALQQVFTAVVHVRFNAAALGQLHQELTGDGQRTARGRAPRPHVPSSTPPAADAEPAAVEPPPFTSAIRFHDLTFTHAGAAAPALRHIDLVLRRNQTVGLVGATGSGKTTLVDLLLGLLDADAGSISVDGVPLTGEMMPAWRRRIGYVPQQIFLADDSVRRNIAFGLPDSEIDEEAVVRAARLACIHDFVAALPDGYDTAVGERGVRLSGGQRQRIGIARALYGNPELLVFDEATSALDVPTEDAVMDAILAVAGQKTVVLIAHRLSTVKACDVVYLLDEGRIVASGRYDELLASEATFRAMTGSPAGT